MRDSGADQARALDDAPVLQDDGRRAEILRWTFSSIATAPSQARARAAAVLTGAPHLDTVLVLVSELVTNAVLHTSHGAELRIFRAGDLIRVEVEDGASDIPESPATVGAHGGFGLRIVGAMATRWGTAPSAHGKVMWFEVDPTTAP